MEGRGNGDLVLNGSELWFRKAKNLGDRRQRELHDNVNVLSATELYSVCVSRWSSPTLCDLMGCSPPGSAVHGILQARALEWVAIPFSGDLPDPGIEPGCPTSHVDSLPSEPPGKPELHS